MLVGKALKVSFYFNFWSTLSYFCKLSYLNKRSLTTVPGLEEGSGGAPKAQLAGLG